MTLLVLGNPDDPIVQRLAGPGVKIAATAAELAPESAGATVLLNWLAGGAELRKTVGSLSNLQWVHTRQAGVDFALTPEMLAHPAVLTNGRGVYSNALGEFVLAGALYFAKDFPRMLRAKAEKRWDVFPVQELRRQTIGIIGYGDIGRAIARRAKAFGMRVLAVRRDLAPRSGDEYTDAVSRELHEVLPQCDYVVLSAPLTPQTRHMISTAEFQAMKPSAIVMNVGRGPVIDEAAMIEALRSGQVRGACLDVFETEPLSPTSPLWDMENVFISAHTADQTVTWMQESMDFFLAQLSRWRNGEPLENVVNKRRGY
jgi:phosphoglycerate dehydrogenase-like enzyme